MKRKKKERKKSEVTGAFFSRAGARHTLLPVLGGNFHGC
jgi:hypothetical protein